MTEKCSYCDSDESFESIGIHWTNADCPGPSLTGRQKDIVKGLILAGAKVEEPTGEQKNARLIKAGVEDEFVDWIRDEFKELLIGELPKRRIETRCSSIFNEFIDADVDDLVDSPLAIRIWYALAGESEKNEEGWKLKLGVENSIATPQYIRDEIIDPDMRWKAKTDMDDPYLLLKGEQEVKNTLEAFGPPLPGYEWKWFPKFNQESWNEMYAE